MQPVSRKIPLELLYPPEEPRHRALDGVVRILHRPDPSTFPSDICIEALVLWDKITELWTSTERLLLWAPYEEVAIIVGSLLHRWLVVDAIYSAIPVQQTTAGKRLIELATNWVKTPSGLNSVSAYYAVHEYLGRRGDASRITFGEAELAAMRACESAGSLKSQATWAVNCASDASRLAAAASFYRNRDLDLDLGVHIPPNPEHETRLRFKLLKALSDQDLLPEPVVTATLQNPRRPQHGQ